MQAVVSCAPAKDAGLCERRPGEGRKALTGAQHAVETRARREGRDRSGSEDSVEEHEAYTPMTLRTRRISFRVYKTKLVHEAKPETKPQKAPRTVRCTDVLLVIATCSPRPIADPGSSEMYDLRRGKEANGARQRALGRARRRAPQYDEVMT